MILQTREKENQQQSKNLYDGVILVDKNRGETSFDVVRRFKKFLNLKKVGHAGTLDPFATGLLIILLGQGTKLSPYLMAGEKRYLATLTLGVETDTLDPTGNIVRTMPVPQIGPERIKEGIRKFVGEIAQVPPVFSAVNYKGKRAYALARKGVKVDLKKRLVTIHSIKDVNIDLPEITIEVRCSGGTYIRSLASDIGKQLGSVAHLSSLRRISSGAFQVRDALDSRDVGHDSQKERFIDRVIPMKDALQDMHESCVDAGTAKRIRQGYRPRWDEVVNEKISFGTSKDFVKLINERSLVAIMEVDPLAGDDNWLSNIRVFN